MSSAPEVSVLIVTFRSARFLPRCLASLADEARRVPLEVIVADNASDDDTVAVARRTAPTATILALTDNRGFAAGNNAAAEAARGEWLLLLNGDAFLQPYALVRLLDAARREPSATILGPRIRRPSGRPELSFGPPVGFAGETRQKLLGRLWQGRFPGAAPLVERLSATPRWPGWVSGACLLVRRHHWLALDGMDEAMFLYLEDADLCARSLASGGRVLYWPAAETVHIGGASGQTTPVRLAIAHRQSQLHYYAKHHGGQAMELLRRLQLLRLGAIRWWSAMTGTREAATRAADLAVAVRAFDRCR